MEKIKEYKGIIVLILLILVGFCYYFFLFKKDNEKFIFENNLKCAQFIEQENKEINEISKILINEKNIVTAPKIFYSPKLNTCVSAYSIISLDKEKGFSSFYIKNLLINDSIWQNGGTNYETVDGISLSQIVEEKYYKKIEELSNK